MSYYIAMDRYGNYDLAHHGILGQKWGIRRFQNKDGSLTDAGKKRYADARQETIHAIVKNSKYNEDISNAVFSVTGADRAALDKAHSVLSKRLKYNKEITAAQEKMFSKLENDTAERVYYQAVSEIASWAPYKNIDDITVSDMAGAAYMSVFEDGGQGSINEYSMYAYKNGLTKKCHDLTVKGVNADREYRNAAKNVVDEALDAVGAKSLTAYAANSNYSVSEALVQRLINAQYDKWADTKGLYLLEYADYANNFTSSDKDSIRKAEKLVSKIRDSHDSNKMLKNTWYLLNEASANLGLSGKKASELSDADWDRINAEIARLKK